MGIVRGNLRLVEKAGAEFFDGSAGRMIIRIAGDDYGIEMQPHPIEGQISRRSGKRIRCRRL